MDRRGLGLTLFLLASCHSATPGGAVPGDPNAPGTPAANDPGRVVGTTNNGGDICGGNLARTTFRFGMCLCDDLAFASALFTDSYHASQGPPTGAGIDGSVGVNGLFRSYGATEIGGSVFVAGDVRPIGAHDIKGELHAGGAVTAAGDIHVHHDAFIETGILGIRTRIDGTLHVPAAVAVGLAVDAAQVVNEPVAVAPPCACAPADLVDIAGFIAPVSSHNDNAAIGLTTTAWSQLIHAFETTLPPGSYYVEEVRTLLPIQLHVSGPTALYIGKDLASASIFEVILDDPRGTLDIFVGGNIVATGSFQLGTRTLPSHVRTYVGGAGDIRMAGDLKLGGNLYAPRSRIVAAGPLDIYGSVFAREVIEAGVINLHYDEDILTPPDTCPDPQGTPQGTPGPQCNNCGDCGNQACSGGTCGACASSTDCCSPLICKAGACQALSL